MAALFNDGDINYLRSLYPGLEIKEPTGQQEQLIMYYLRGKSISFAAKTAGYKSADSAREYLNTDSAKMLIKLLRERELESVSIDLDTATGMLLEAYHLAATSGEKISAVRELAKLHDLYPTQRKSLTIIPGNETPTKSNLRRYTDEQLAKLIGTDSLSLPPPIEGEFETVPEQLEPELVGVPVEEVVVEKAEE